MMAVFNKNFTLAYIKEIGENDILISVKGKDIELELTDENREPIFSAIEEDIFVLPYSEETNELLMNVDEETIKEIFPELELEELQGVTDEIPEENQ